MDGWPVCVVCGGCECRVLVPSFTGYSLYSSSSQQTNLSTSASTQPFLQNKFSTIMKV